MEKALRIILLEDLDTDAHLVERELKKGKILFELLWVTNKIDFQKALDEFQPDIVISDHSLPSFNSGEALKMVQSAGVRIPFILVTATISEELVVSMMKQGIDDYILKDRLQRLPTAVINAIKKVTAEREKEKHYRETINKEKKFRALIENISDAIILVSEAGNILYHSPSVKRITGFDLDEMPDKNFFDFVHEEDVQACMRFFKIVLQNPEIPFHDSYRVLQKNGSYIWVEGTITNLLDDESVNALIINYRDITQRKISAQLLQKSEANLQTIFDNTNTSYLFTDKKFNLVSFNRSAALRYKKEMNITLTEGQNLIDLLPPKRKKELKKRYELALSGEKVKYEVSYIQPDKNIVWYDMSVLPVYDNIKQASGLIISAEDITDRKIAEQEREKMTSDIIQHNKNLEQFAYIISHNLRAPVANIIGLSSLIQNISISKEDYERCVDGLVLSVSKLDEVIVDLNFILQVRREINEKKEPVRFSAIIESIKASISNLIEKENVVIITDFKEDKFFTIKSYLNSILFNLISNSIKYRKPDEPALIKISSVKTGDKVTIFFTDNGMGIDLDAHGSKIFGLYKKFHMHKEGKGMGLYMVKTQVEILGGTISIESEVNKGTSFQIEFDLSE